MHRLKSIAREILGLFVEDGSFAIAILMWVGVVVLVLAHVIAHIEWVAPILLAGLAILLIESVLRFARRRPPN